MQLNLTETSNRTQPWVFPYKFRAVYEILSLDQRTLSWLIISLTDLPIHPQFSFQEPSNLCLLLATGDTEFRDLNMEKPTEGNCRGGALQKMEDGILHGKQHTALMLVL